MKFTCVNPTKETQEQYVKSAQSYDSILKRGSDNSISDFEQGNADWDISFSIEKKQRLLSKVILSQQNMSTIETERQMFRKIR